MTNMLKSPEEALTMALALAITAPTEEGGDVRSEQNDLLLV